MENGLNEIQLRTEEGELLDALRRNDEIYTFSLKYAFRFDSDISKGPRLGPVDSSGNG